MSKEFKSLNLCREKIDSSIEEYLKIKFSEVVIGKLTKKGGSRRRVEIKTSEGAFHIDFHFNGDGTTTIEDFGGAKEFVQIKKEIALFIKEQCMITCNNNTSWFVIKGIEKKDFELIMELLIESEYSQSKMVHNKSENDISTMYKLKGLYNEDLTITYYKTKKVQIQGKPLLLFNEAISMFSEFLELDEIPKCYNELYKLDIDNDAVRERFIIYI